MMSLLVDFFNCHNNKNGMVFLVLTLAFNSSYKFPNKIALLAEVEESPEKLLLLVLLEPLLLSLVVATKEEVEAGDFSATWRVILATRDTSSKGSEDDRAAGQLLMY